MSVVELPDARAMTVADIYRDYAPLLFSDVTARTAYTYRNAFRLRVGPTLGPLPITDVTGLQVRLAWAKWSGADSTKIDALAVTSKILSVAVDAGLVASNPCRGLRLKRRGGKSPAARALTVAQLNQFIALTPAGPYRHIIQALAYTGCRLGEIAGLTSADVDWPQGLIRVSRSLSPNPSGALEAGDTKSHRDRVVPVIPQLLPVLHAAAVGKGPHDLLFTGPRGGALDSSNLTRSIGLRQWRDEVRVYPPGQPPLHLHDLRHTAATMLCRAGVPVHEVQAILGHSSLAVTQLYARAHDDAALRAGRRFSEFLRGASSEIGTVSSTSM